MELNLGSKLCNRCGGMISLSSLRMILRMVCSKIVCLLWLSLRDLDEETRHFVPSFLTLDCLSFGGDDLPDFFLRFTFFLIRKRVY